MREDVNISTFVIKITASDADSGENGRLNFTITSGNELDHFKIHPDTGNIYTNALLDFETTPSYTIRVKVEDKSHGNHTDVSIRLIDVNDNDPIFNPPQYYVSVSEDSGKDELLQLNATDKDEFGGLTYTILDGNTNSRFALNPGNGKLRVAGELDRELSDSYNLTVRVTDSGAPERFDTALVAIRITDVNDNAPRFDRTRVQVSVTENAPLGTRVHQAVARDIDIGPNGRVSYEIINGNADGLFKLENISGVLTVNGVIDRENEPTYRYVCFVSLFLLKILCNTA